jgi:hypothetical protein
MRQRHAEIYCQDLVEVVTDFLEDALDPDTRRRFVEHLQLCLGCDAYLAQLRATVHLTGTLRTEQADPGLRERLLAAFRRWKAEGSG